jgi:hypothetical protein
VRKILDTTSHYVALPEIIVFASQVTPNKGGSLFWLRWLRLATSGSTRFGAASPYLFVRKILYVIGRRAPRVAAPRP